MECILFFDCKCLMCNSFIRFIFRMNTSQNIKFSAFDSTVSFKLGIDKKGDTMVFLLNNRFYYKSEALIKILEEVKFNRYLVFGVKLVPKVLRDGVYSLISLSRMMFNFILPKKANCEFDQNFSKRILK